MFLPSSSDTPKPEEPPLSPRLALRLAILGMLGLAAFGVLVFRLWPMRAPPPGGYQREAQQTQGRLVPLPAPRGAILDDTGKVLVRNRPGIDLQIDANRLRKPVARLIVLN